MKKILLLTLSLASISSFTQSIQSRVVTPDSLNDANSLQAFLSAANTKQKEAYSDFHIEVESKLQHKVDELKNDLLDYLRMKNIKTDSDHIQSMLTSLDSTIISLKYYNQRGLDKTFGFHTAYLTINVGQMSDGVSGHTYEDQAIFLEENKEIHMNLHMNELLRKLKNKMINKIEKLHKEESISILQAAFGLDNVSTDSSQRDHSEKSHKDNLKVSKSIKTKKL